MRTVPAAALLAVLSVGAPALAMTVSTPVQVTLKVAASCTIGAQTASVPPSSDASLPAKPELALGSLLSGCSGQEVSPALSVESDRGNEGFYVATINF